jgi:MFS family permease
MPRKKIKSKAKQTKKQNPVNVIWLGIVSMLTDVSSEMLFPIIPLFLTTILKANMAVVGLIEGLAEGTAAILKFISGIVSDRFKNKKTLTIAGYGISTFAKPIMAIATVWPHVLIMRVLDRVGKGIRTSPRDALIAASVKKQDRGKYFGIHRTMDTLGAVVGVFIVTILLFTLGESEASFRTIFWLATIPAAIAVILLFIFVRDKDEETKHKSVSKKPLHLFKVWKTLHGDLKTFLFIIAAFNMASFSYAFFLIRADDVGFTLTLIPLLYLIYNIFYAISAYPAGKISDKIGRNIVLAVGFFLFALTCLGFAFIPSTVTLWVLFALYGIFVGLTDGVSRAFIADLSTEKNSGTVFGMYHMVVGLTVFPANIIGGFLWATMSAQAPFIYAAVIAVGAAVALLVFQNKLHTKQKKTQMDASKFKAYR